MVKKNHIYKKRYANKPLISMWLQYYAYDTKAECDAIIQYCKDNGITDLDAIAVNSDATPKVCMGNSTLCNVTSTNIDGMKPIRYLAREAKTHGIRVHAWWCIYIWTWWGTSNAVLLSPLTDNATNHDTSNGGSTLNFSQSSPRTTVINAIKDFAKENPEVYGVNLDYIRTDGTVTGQTDANVTSFVSECRTAIPDRELSACTLSVLNITYPVHQDMPSWINNRYIDTCRVMGYYTSYPLKLYHMDQADLSKVRFFMGTATEQNSSDWAFNCTRPSDLRTTLRQHSELGYPNACIFDWVDAMDTVEFQEALSDYLHGKLQAVVPYPAITKITVTPATSFSLDIGGSTYTTLYSAITDHITTASLKTHVEGIEGQRPWIHYYRPENNSTYVRILAGDWLP